MKKKKEELKLSPLLIYTSLPNSFVVSSCSRFLIDSSSVSPTIFSRIAREEEGGGGEEPGEKVEKRARGERRE